VLSFRVLSQRNLSYRSRRSSLNPRPVNLLQPLDSLFLTPILCFQQLAASFHKTPGVGVLFGFRPTIQSLTSAFATVTHSLSRKSFPCHSYANTREGGATRPSPNLEHLTSNLCFYRYMRHVAPLSPVPSLDCAYLPSPRGCTHCAFQISLHLWQTQLARPLFSYSYQPLFPQLPYAHIHPIYRNGRSIKGKTTEGMR